MSQTETVKRCEGCEILKISMKECPDDFDDYVIEVMYSQHMREMHGMVT